MLSSCLMEVLCWSKCWQRIQLNYEQWSWLCMRCQAGDHGWQTSAWRMDEQWHCLKPESKTHCYSNYGSKESILLWVCRWCHTLPIFYHKWWYGTVAIWPGVEVETNPGGVKSQEVSVGWPSRQSTQSGFLHNVRVFSSTQTVDCQHVNLILCATS